MWKKRPIVYEAFMELGCSLRSVDILTKHKYSSLRSMKRRECVFSPKAQKRYVYKSFMHRKEVNCKIVYILDSKLYMSAFRPQGVPGPTSKLSPHVPAQMGRRETEHKGGRNSKGETRGLRVVLRPGRVRLQ
jgi:hypothetical protein